MKHFFYVFCFIWLIVSCTASKPVKTNEKTENTTVSKSEETKANTTKTTTAKITDEEKRLNPDKWVNPFEGWKPTWQPGTYFTKNFPEHAWLDTIDYDDLKSNGWIEVYREDVNNDFELNCGARFTKEFLKIFPEVPKDSIVFYTAHWFELDENSDFVKKAFHFNSSQTEDSRMLVQNYRGLRISGGDRMPIINYSYKKVDLKPAAFGVKVYKSLNFKNDYYRFDKLKATKTINNELIKNIDENKNNPFFLSCLKSNSEYNFKNEIFIDNQNALLTNYVSAENCENRNIYKMVFLLPEQKLFKKIKTTQNCFTCANNSETFASTDLFIGNYRTVNGNFESVEGTIPFDSWNSIIWVDGIDVNDNDHKQSVNLRICDSNGDGNYDSELTNSIYDEIQFINNNAGKTYKIEYQEIDINQSPSEINLNEVCTNGASGSPWSKSLVNSFYYSLEKTNDFIKDLIGQANLPNEVTLSVRTEKLYSTNSVDLTLDKHEIRLFSGIKYVPASISPPVTEAMVIDQNDKPAFSIDVIGHEYGHILINRIFNNQTMFQNGQAYAIKEGICDIFGCTAEATITTEPDWQIQNNVRLNETRNIRDPYSSTPNPQPISFQDDGTGTAGQPGNGLGQYFDNNSAANGHFNNGVINYWFYVLNNGGNAEIGSNPTNFGIDKCNIDINGDEINPAPTGCQTFSINTGWTRNQICKLILETLNQPDANEMFEEITTDVTFQQFCRRTLQEAKKMIEDGKFGAYVPNECTPEQDKAWLDIVNAWKIVGVPCGNEEEFEGMCGFYFNDEFDFQITSDCDQGEGQYTLNYLNGGTSPYTVTLNAFEADNEAFSNSNVISSDYALSVDSDSQDLLDDPETLTDITVMITDANGIVANASIEACYNDPVPNGGSCNNGFPYFNNTNFNYLNNNTFCPGEEVCMSFDIEDYFWDAPYTCIIGFNGNEIYNNTNIDNNGGVGNSASISVCFDSELTYNINNYITIQVNDDYTCEGTANEFIPLNFHSLNLDNVTFTTSNSTGDCYGIDMQNGSITFTEDDLMQNCGYRIEIDGISYSDINHFDNLSAGAHSYCIVHDPAMVSNFDESYSCGNFTIGQNNGSTFQTLAHVTHCSGNCTSTNCDGTIEIEIDPDAVYDNIIWTCSDYPYFGKFNTACTTINDGETLITGVCPGVYTYEIVDENGNCIATETFIVYPKIFKGLQMVATANAQQLRVYPSVYSTNTNIEFEAEDGIEIDLKIVDANGNTVETLIDKGVYSEGKHTINYQAANDPSGVYFIALEKCQQIWAKMGIKY